MEKSPLLVGLQTYTATLEINTAVSQKIGNKFTSRTSYITPGHILRGYFILPQLYLFNYVHISFILNSQKVEKT